MTCEALPIEQGSDAWAETRRSCIGASEAAAACGLSPYLTARELWEEKSGLRGGRQDSIRMQAGILLEPVVAQLYSDRHSVSLGFRLGLLVNSERRWQVASADAAVLPVNDWSEATLVELKTCNWRRAKELGEEDSDQVPRDWLCQAQHQMAVTGAAAVDFAVLVDCETYREFRVLRDDRLIDLLTAREEEFMACLRNGVPPELDCTHPTALDHVREEYRGILGGSVAPDSEALAADWHAQVALGKQIADLQKRRDFHMTRVLEAMASHEWARVGNGRAARRRLVKRKAYQVKPCEYVTVSEASFPSSLEPTISERGNPDCER